MNATKIIKIVLITVIVILCVLISQLNKNLRALEVIKTKNDSTIATYQAKEEERTKTTVKKETITLTPEQKQEDASKAIELGLQVCEYQNAYFNIDTNDMDAFYQNMESLRACFAKEDAGNAGTPWYSRYTSLKCKWTYLCNTKDGGQDSLWLCQTEDTGVLLAYATADYNHTTGLFDTLAFTYTFAGNAAAGASESEPETTDPIVEDVNQLVDEMTTEDNGEQTPTVSSEEVEQQAGARASNIENRQKMLEEAGDGE